jgi:hypothetical protein
VTTSTSHNAYWLDGEGRIRNCYNERVFTTRRFDDVIDADYWLTFVSPDGQFGTAYIAGRLRDADGLGRWLTRQGCQGDELTCEMLDAMPRDLRGTAEQLLFPEPEGRQ